MLVPGIRLWEPIVQVIIPVLGLKTASVTLWVTVTDVPTFTEIDVAELVVIPMKLPNAVVSIPERGYDLIAVFPSISHLNFSESGFILI